MVFGLLLVSSVELCLSNKTNNFWFPDFQKQHASHKLVRIRSLPHRLRSVTFVVEYRNGTHAMDFVLKSWHHVQLSLSYRNPREWMTLYTILHHPSGSNAYKPQCFFQGEQYQCVFAID